MYRDQVVSEGIRCLGIMTDRKDARICMLKEDVDIIRGLDLFHSQCIILGNRLLICGSSLVSSQTFSQTYHSDYRSQTRPATPLQTPGYRTIANHTAAVKLRTAVSQSLGPLSSVVAFGFGAYDLCGLWS